MQKALEMNERVNSRYVMMLVYSICFNNLDIRMKLYKTEEHQNIANTFNNAASIYKQMDQLENALEMNE